MKNPVFIAMFLIVSFASALNGQWVRSGIPHTGSISSFAVLDSYLFAGSSTDGVLRSNDSGRSWIDVNRGISNVEVNGLCSLNNNLYAATMGGVFRSSDYGVSWVSSNKGLENLIEDKVWFYKIVTAGSSLIIGLFRLSIDATAGNIDTLTTFYKSTNHGESWQSANIGIRKNIDAKTVRCLFYNGVFLFGSTNDGIYRSSNEGSSWEYLGLMKDKDGIGHTAHDFVQIDSLLFASSRYQPTFKSTDNGNTWSQLKDPPSTIRMGVIDSNLFSFDRKASYSSNGGVSWVNRDSGIYLQTYAYASTTMGKYIFAGGYNGVFRLAFYDSIKWSHTLFPEQIYSMCQNGKYLFASSDDGAMKRSGDLGNNWENIRLGDGYVGASVVAANGPTLFAATSGRLLRSKDDGGTWELLLDDDKQIRAVTVNNGVVWVSQIQNSSSTDYPPRSILRSTDDGNTWIDLGSGFPANGNNYVVSFAFSDSTVFLQSALSIIYRSTNNGLSWQETSVPGGKPIQSVPQAIGYCAPYVYVFYNLTMFRSSDQGDSWSYLGNWFPSAGCYSLIAYDTMIVAATSSGVYKYNNHDTVWRYVSHGLNTTAGVRSLLYTGSHLFAGTMTSGVWKRPMAEVSVKKDKIFSSSTKIGNNYPNPFTEKTTIEFFLTQPENVTIKMFDALGREVTTLAHDSYFGIGSHHIEWDASTQEPGIYFCRLFQKDGIASKAMLLVK